MSRKDQVKSEIFALIVHNVERSGGATNGPVTAEFSSLKPVSDPQKRRNKAYRQQLNINLL